jgi:hypothetical protein
LIHKSKGISTGRGYGDDMANKIISIYKSDYYGWNYSHFKDALEEDKQINVSISYITKLLRKNGIKSPKSKRQKKKAHPPRPRRENAGELLQVDASKHQWLYDDNTYYYLHGSIDDSTGIVTACVMLPQELTKGYQILLKDTMSRYGIPRCLYTDYRTVFQSGKKLTVAEELSGKQLNSTKFANMAKRLGIDIISTVDPRAKGRIERLWGTFQDRLVKELARHKIDSLKEANHYINDVFLPKYNARFASRIDYNRNVFTCVPEDFDYNIELALVQRRKLIHNCYIRADKKYYKLQHFGNDCRLEVNSFIDVYTFLDGTYHFLYNNSWYDLVPFEKTEKKKPKLAGESLIEARIRGGKNNLNSPWRKNNINFFPKYADKYRNANTER